MSDERLPLTRTSDVRAALATGARIVRDEKNTSLLHLVAADGTPIPAWQNALRSASRSNKES